MNLLRNKYSIAITIAIVVLSLIPIPEKTPMEDIPFVDKWVHFLMYGTLTLAMWVDRGGWKQKITVCTGAMLLLLPSLLGGLMEIAQEQLTDCRSGDFIDFIADAFGAVIGLIICFILQYYGKRKF